MVLVVLNFSEDKLGVKLQLPGERLLDPSSKGLVFEDVFSGTLGRMKTEFLIEFPLRLTGRGYKIFLLSPW